jgi:hypothetical protein
MLGQYIQIAGQLRRDLFVARIHLFHDDDPSSACEFFRARCVLNILHACPKADQLSPLSGAIEK